MFQGGWKMTHASEVRRLLIPHRPRGGHAPGTSVSPRLSRIQAPGQARCRNRHVALPAAHIRERDMERPKCQVHVHGHARHFHARSVIDHDLIVTSLHVQVPTDTIFCDYLAWELGLRQKWYWITRGGIETIWRCVLSTIHRCSVITARPTFFSRDLARARTGQPGGLGN